MAGQWTFLSNHGHVLVLLAQDPDIRLRDLAATIGITERAAQMIVGDLEAAGYVTKQRVGRRNHYTLNPRMPLRHRHAEDHEVQELLAMFTGH